jgi:hypothetical protein
VALAAVLVYAAVVVLVGRALRRRQIESLLASTGASGDAGGDASSTTQRARLAWYHAGRHLAVAGLRRVPSETPNEFADRVLAVTDLSPDTMASLANLEVAATYGTRPPAEPHVAAAEDAVQHIHSWVRTNTSLWERVRFLLDPRPLLPRRQRVVPSTPLTARA